MKKRFCIAAVLWSAVVSAGDPPAPQLEGTPEPGYASCAAFYFVSANGKTMKEYDDLYRAGEDTLNAAKRALGSAAGDRAMETASGQLMKAIDRNWLFVDVLGKKYLAPCAALREKARAGSEE